MVYAPNSLAARDVEYSLHPYTNFSAHEDRGPFVITRGDNIYVWDDDGERYIEGMAGLWCTSLGFNEQRLIDAATRQLGTLPYTHNFAHRSSEPVIDLAERVIRLAPEGLGKAFFTASGSEAIDSAIKFAWYYNNSLGRRDKKKIIARRRAYHGITIASGSLTSIPLMNNDFDLPIDPQRFLHVDTPHHYRGAHDGESEEDFATRLAEQLDELITREGADTVAAFVAEPVMGAGGVIPPPATYFDKVQEVLKKHDVLFVADEVICGFGRTGNMFGCETYGIKPDMMTVAKQLSSAYLPIAGLLISDTIYDAFKENTDRHGAFGMGFTYGGHPVSAAVAVETLKIYDERNIVDHVRSVMPRFQQRLAALGEGELVGETRGVGLIGALEIVSDKGTKEQFAPAAKAAMRVSEHARQAGLIVRPLPQDAVAVCPPLIITEEQVDDLFDRFEAGLASATTEIKAL